MNRPPDFCWLPADALPHWRAVEAGLPASAPDVHLVLAAHLARVMADIERLDAERRAADDPRRVALLLRISESATRAAIALTRAIGLALSARHKLVVFRAGRAAERAAHEAVRTLADITG